MFDSVIGSSPPGAQVDCHGAVEAASAAAVRHSGNVYKDTPIDTAETSSIGYIVGDFALKLVCVFDNLASRIGARGASAKFERDAYAYTGFSTADSIAGKRTPWCGLFAASVLKRACVHKGVVMPSRLFGPFMASTTRMKPHLVTGVRPAYGDICTVNPTEVKPYGTHVSIFTGSYDCSEKDSIIKMMFTGGNQHNGRVSTDDYADSFARLFDVEAAAATAMHKRSPL